MADQMNWLAVGSEDRERMERLFDAALGVPPMERRAFLLAQEGVSSDMASGVLALIEVYEQQEQSGGWNTPLVSPEELLQGDEMAGVHVGSWRLERLLGRGGMGAVYFASRSAGEFEQQAAVKLIGARLATGILAERFREERQILARLEHPHIARLLDGGATAEGDPFLVMEYVDGEPLTRFCESRKLPLRRRLELFLDVCSAVEYAHQNLVVHRDLKPDNILVTAAGEAKLVDFGTSKLLSAAGSEPGLVTQLRMITPRFASPEQIVGDPVTTLSDVYSLGVILSCLLSGDVPYRLSTGAAGEVERAVLEGNVMAPSAVAAARGLNKDWQRQLRGDLDAIVLKSVEKLPRNRYNSVEKLAGDVRRHLAGLPVSARQRTLSYRASKYLRRHAVGVAAAAAVALVLLGASAYSLRQARKADLERRRTARVNEFVTQLIGSADPSWYSPFRSKGKEVRVVEVLEEADKRLSSGIEDEPAIEAELRRTLGNTYTAIGIAEPARRNLEEALRIQIQATGRLHPDTANSLFLLGQAEHFAGDLKTAKRHYEEALRLQKDLGGRADPVVTMKTTNNLGIVHWIRGDVDTTIRLLSDTLRMADELSERGVQGKALALGNLALAYDGKGDIQRALDLYNQSLDAFGKIPGRRMMEVGFTIHNIGVLRRFLGDEEGANRQFVAACREFDSSVGADHPNALAPALELALSNARLGHVSEAEARLRELTENSGKHLPPEHFEHGRAWTYLGDVLLMRGKVEEAESLLRRAVGLRRKVHGPDDFRTAYSEAVLGQCLLMQGRRAEGEALIRKGIANTARAFGEKHPRVDDIRRRIPPADRARWAAK